MKQIAVASLLLLAGGVATSAPLTPTEHLGIRVLPAPGKIAVDGKFDDWDLSGGIFACDDAENQRERFAVWIHLMHDEDNLYVLARFKDETPLNNPGQTAGDYGFAGDSLQIRFTLAPGLPDERTSHWTCWKGRDGAEVMDVEYGKKFDQGKVRNARAQGAQQGFQKDADGKGYSQEIAIPWKLLTKDGRPATAGQRLQVTVEPNFTIGTNGRLTVKDIFKAGVTPDRVFTFMASDRWGFATIEKAGRVPPQPVRLADGREFAVRLENGLPVVDWTGLIKQKELAGFKPITLTLPEDGTVSLNIFDEHGAVARQLLSGVFLTRGTHTIQWDGLTTPSWTRPGEPVPPGAYTWSALHHRGIGLRLRGWACNAGSAPWDGDSGKENWGGDHGLPGAAASDGETVYLGWSGAEAGKALLACDLQGKVKWKNSRQGMCGALFAAVDGGFVYAVNWGPKDSNYLYRLDAKTGGYAVWEGTDSPDIFPRNLWKDKAKPDRMDGLDARDGRVFMAFTSENTVLVLDGRSGKELKSIRVPSPSAVKGAGAKRFYAISNHSKVLSIDAESGEISDFAEVQDGRSLTVDRDGRVYVGSWGAEQVRVFSADGKPLLDIGRAGGRPWLGGWNADGLVSPGGLAVDGRGQLWVMEHDQYPKRVSVWDAKTGKFLQELFGPTNYGAMGGVINPLDPNLMVGQGCEWRLDPKSGRAACLGVITRDGMENSRFGTGANGRLYLAVASKWTFESGPVRIFERIGDGDYKLRAMFRYEGKDKAAKTIVWSDENGDGQEQPGEVIGVPGTLRFSSWYMAMAPDLTISAGDRLLKVTGFTSCGAPKWDLDGVKMPTAGFASADSTLVLKPGEYGVNHGIFTCSEIATGKPRWTYPDNFVGVHGSHNACPAEAGMIRGSFGPTASVRLPDPIGNVWVIPTNVGEWHLLTERGYYLTRLFQGDAMKFSWPSEAVPGAVMDNCPCGMGGEDFGGSVTLGKDGKLYVQSGKTGFWNLEVVGLDAVKEISGGTIRIEEGDRPKAVHFKDLALQASVGKRRVSVHRMTPAFTGNLDADFKGAEIATYGKQEKAAIRSAAAWDDRNLYLAWDVSDPTPWANGADAAEEMYLRGDTVDFQLAADPKADPNRDKAVRGDLRLSIGNFKGQPTAVLYRAVAQEKAPRTFSSGVIKEYVMDSVVVLKDAVLKATKHGNRYVVEAAVPLAALDLRLPETLRGDFGVTHGDPAGQRTRLRSYWSNQHTGIVDDAVFELMMEPKYWGEIQFQE